MSPRYPFNIRSKGQGYRVTKCKKNQVIKWSACVCTQLSFIVLYSVNPINQHYKFISVAPASHSL